MKLGVISDTHDQIWNLEKALQQLKSIEVIIHCGDLVSPFMVRHLAEGAPKAEIRIVWAKVI